jgi:hypothetical protein
MTVTQPVKKFSLESGLSAPSQSISFFKIRFSINILFRAILVGSFFEIFEPKFVSFPSTPMHAACPTWRIILDLEDGTDYEAPSS